MEKKLPAIKSDFNVVFKPGTISIVGFEEIRGELADKMEKFKVLVSEDGVKDAKKDAAALNKLAKAIDDKRKEIKKEYEKPLKEFESKMKELVAVVKDTRGFLVSQIDKYENEKKEEIKTIVENYIKSLYELHNIPEEFRLLNVEKYVKLSAVTKSGNIAKQTATEIENDIKDILIQIKEKEEEEARKQAEIERIKREAIEEYKAKEIEEVVEEAVKVTKEQSEPKKDKVTYVVTYTYEVVGSPGKTDDEVIAAVEKLINAGKLKPKIFVKRI